MQTERPSGGPGRPGHSARIRGQMAEAQPALAVACDAGGTTDFVPLLTGPSDNMGVKARRNKARPDAAGHAGHAATPATVKKAAVSAPSSPPVIAGTEDGQATYDSASLKPFAAVSITDPNAGAQTETVTIVLSNSANGTLTDPAAATYGSAFVNGTFTVSGTAAQVTSDLDGLVFTPYYGLVTPYGATLTTGFTLTVSDTAGATATDGTTTVIATATAPYSSLASFSLLLNEGGEPVGGLIADANGDLFGTTSYGIGQGVYEIQKTATGFSSTLVMLASLGPATGYQSQAGLIADTNGDLFGTTYYDGADGDGTVFEIVKTAGGYASQPTILLNFNGTGTGADPLSGLTMDANGDLFGTTQDGGTANQGTVFELPLTANGYAATPTILLNFDSGSGSGTASEPFGGLLADANGNLFGTTQDGGTGNVGTVFEIARTANGYAATPTILLNFNYTNGADPRDGLTEDAKGDLFGTAIYGGANGEGVVFEIAKTASGYAGTPTILLSFNGTDGADPQGGLIADANGDLFGTTLRGGTYGDGTVFELLDTASGYAGTPITLLSFDGANGAGPASNLTVSAGGTLFGTTEGGGAYGWGTAFDVAATGFAVAAPVVSGTVAGQTTTSEAPAQIFAGVSLTDANSFGAESDTLAITYAGGGKLSGSGLLAGSGGSYTLTGTAAAVTAALDSLVFTPNAGAPGSAATTSFTLTAINAPFGTQATDSTTTLTDIDPAVAPTLAASGNTSFTTASEAAVKPFAGVTVSDPNNGGADTDTLAITLSGSGSLSGAGLTSANGTYTLSGTAGVITGELQALVFTPVDGVPNTSVTTGFRITDKSSASATSAVNTAISVTDSDPAVAPTIAVSGGTSFTTASEAAVKPFAGVTLGDLNNGGSDTGTLAIVLSGGGALSGSGLSVSNGIYTLIGTAAVITSEVHALVFTPVDGIPNTSATTGLTLTYKSSAFSTAAVNAAITVTDSDPAVPPTISVTGSTSFTTPSGVADKPFAGVTIADPNNGGADTDTLSITLSGSGSLTGTGLTSSNGTYTLSGTAAAITSDVQALLFTAMDTVPNTSITTSFTLSDKSSADSTAAVNSAISVIDPDPAVAPAITTSGTTSFATTSEATVKPFAGVTVADTNNNGSDTDTLTIALSSAGSLSGTGLSGSGGTYTLTGSATALTSELQALVFTPVDGVPNSSVTTTFTLSDKSSASATAATSSAITVTDTDPPAVSTLGGMAAGQTTTDESTIKPFAAVTITDPNAGAQSDALVITLSGGDADGRLSGTDLTYLGPGSYTLEPASPAVLNADLQALVFTPTAHQVAPGSSVTTTFSLIVVNEQNLVSAANATTTVIATAVNDAPTIAGTVANQALRDTATIKPFAAATITDPDLSVSDSLTITLKNSGGTATDADGSLSGTGLGKTGTGTYALAATSPATLTSELESLVFTPTAHQVNQGSTVTTGFTLSASQTAGGSTVSSTSTATSVIVTAAGIAPTISVSGSTTITDSFDAAVKPFTGVTVADLNDLGGDTDTLVISETGLGGSFSAGPTLTGSAASINSALQNLTFTPAGSVFAENTVFSFSLTSSGYGTATVASNAITITSSMLIAAMPVVKALSAATEAGQGSGLSDLLGTHAPTATDWGMHDTLALPETFDGADDFPMAAGNVFGTPATHFGADTPGLAHVLNHGFIVW